MPTADQGTLRVSPTRLSHNDDSDRSVDSTRQNLIYIRNFRTTENQQAQSSSADLPQSYDLRPRLPPRDCHEKVIQNKISPKMRCIPISEPAATSSQLTQSQKRDAIICSCQRRRTLLSSSEIQTDPNVHNTYTHFNHSDQSAPPGYLERQKEVRKRYSLKNLQKRFSSKNDVNAVIDSNVHTSFCFSQSNILAATTCIAHSVSFDFAMGKGLASALACSYPELQQMQKMSFNLPPGSLLAYFDQQNNRYLHNLVTKNVLFINLPMENSIRASNR